MLKWFERVARHRAEKELERYLGRSVDIYDVERRSREWERRNENKIFWK